MSNYWVDLINRKEQIKKMNEDRERKEFEEIIRDLQNRERLRALFDSQRKQSKQ